MTISDVRGQFNIEGKIKVMKYHADAELNEEYEVCHQQTSDTAYNIPDELCNIPITHMYAKDNYLVIELETDEDAS